MRGVPTTVTERGDVDAGCLTRRQQRTKRALDIALVSLGLIVAAPVLAVIALAIALESRGPLLVGRPRVGRGGRTFRLHTFRTRAADGARDTTVGRLLRRTSLDQLPQLLNVLRGDMSLVGPRPLAVDDTGVEAQHRRRLHLAPGMTGPWQVLGAPDLPPDEIVALDDAYAAEWSLWSDLAILVRTVGRLLGRPAS